MDRELTQRLEKFAKIRRPLMSCLVVEAILQYLDLEEKK